MVSGSYQLCRTMQPIYIFTNLLAIRGFSYTYDNRVATIQTPTRIYSYLVLAGILWFGLWSVYYKVTIIFPLAKAQLISMDLLCDFFNGLLVIIQILTLNNWGRNRICQILHAFELCDRKVKFQEKSSGIMTSFQVFLYNVLIGSLAAYTSFVWISSYGWNLARYYIFGSVIKYISGLSLVQTLKYAHFLNLRFQHVNKTLVDQLSLSSGNIKCGKSYTAKKMEAYISKVSEGKNIILKKIYDINYHANFRQKFV